MRPDQSKILLAAILQQVPFDGWTVKAYEEAIKIANMSKGEAHVLFPSGLRDVIDLFLADADRAMEQKIAKTSQFKKLKVREKISFAIEARLAALEPHREAFRRLLYWYAVPTHAPLAMRRLFKTTDLIWRLAGDQSTDFNYYTKRGLLAFVLKTTVLFWLDDESDGSHETKQFLARRISNVLKIGQLTSRLRRA